jgi:hypothetical protein
MSLDDKFNPNEGSFIDKVDGALLKVHKKIGEVWQNKTYKSKNELARNLHGGSSGAYLINATTGNYLSSLLSLIEGAKFALGFSKHSTGLEQEIESEARGLPKKAGKYFDVTLYGLGVVITIAGASTLVYGAVLREGDVLTSGTSLLSNGLGLMFWKTGDYLEKIDAGEPPKKPKKKPVLERIKEKVGGLLPQPTPEPVPAQAYSTLDNYIQAQPHK